MSSLSAPLASILLVPFLLGTANAAGNADHGKIIFQQSCAICHATGDVTQPQGGQGPLLAGIVGRPAGSLASYGYTKALAASHLMWDDATLDKFLASPTTVVPGTNMVVPTTSATDRHDLIAYLATLKALGPSARKSAKTHSGTAGDWQNDAPGNIHRIDLTKLPAPYATASAGNFPKTVDRPPGANPVVPEGFQVKLFLSDLSGPRMMRTAPNGDIFIAETRQGRIRVLRAPDGAEAPTENSVFAEGLPAPSGIAFYPVQGEPKWVYIGNTNSVVRYRYQNGDLKATGPAETVVAKLTGSKGGHSTRDIVFSDDGKRMFVAVGSGSNVAEGLPDKSPAEIKAWEKSTALGAAWGAETDRASVLVFDPEGHNLHFFATGIRNAVGLAIQPANGKLWVSTNERDDLGDDLVPDYISHIQEGGFYGWPWYYFGNHEDPRHAGKRPDLAGKAIVPDVPVQAHSASLQLTFYPQNANGSAAFAKNYRGDIFAALHGSWNRTGRTGSKVIRIHLQDGKAAGEYEDFMTGFVVDDGHVWGRPVGVTVAHDGALLVSDDANGTLWRIAPAKK